MKNKLEEKSIVKLMVELCIQTTFSIMLYNFYTITDTFFVSSGVGSVASGAIGILSPLFFLINGISSTLGVGGGSMISRNLGAEKIEENRYVVGCIMWIWLVCSGLITVVSLVFMNPLLRILGCTDEIYPYALVYGRIMLLSTVASTGFSGIMRAGGDSVYSTLQWCCPVMINLILDPIFIYIFKWGIGGAALATLCAQIVSMVSSFYYFFLRSNTLYKIRFRDLRWRKWIGKEVLMVGFPTFLTSLGNSFAGTITNQVLGMIGGTQAISIYTIICKIQNFVTTPFSGVMQGIQPMIGFDLGKKKIKRVKKTIKYAFSAAVLYGSFVTAMMHIGAKRIFEIFTSDPLVIGMGKDALKIMCLSFLIGGIMPIVLAFFQASGNGKQVFILSVLSLCAVRIPLLIAMGYIERMQVMWWILVCIEWIIAVVSYYYFRKGRGAVYAKLDEE